MHSVLFLTLLTSCIFLPNQSNYIHIICVVNYRTSYFLNIRWQNSVTCLQLNCSQVNIRRAYVDYRRIFTFIQSIAWILRQTNQRSIFRIHVFPKWNFDLILLQNNTSITTSTQLRVVLGVSKALVSRSITSLEQKGLITLKKVSENRRISYIELTEEAIPILAKISIEIDKINQVLFKDIPIKDIQCMIDTMNKMNEKIEGAK